MANGERNMEVCPGEEQAGDEAGTRDQRREDAHVKVTPPLAVAPITQDDDMRWNPNDDGIVVNDDGIVSNPYKGAARPITTPITTYHHIKHAPATSHKNQVNSLYM